MRTEMPEPERRLWHELRAGRLGVKFARQVPIGPYIADFAARREKLVIEIDGDTHDPVADARRDAFFAEQGFRVLRFGNRDVIENLEGVCNEILRVLGRL